MNLQKHLLVVLSFLLLLACETKSKKEFTENDITIIPKPVKTILGKGSFTLDKNTIVVLSDENQEQAIDVLNSKLNTTSGWKLQFLDKVPSSNFIELSIDKDIEKDGYSLLTTNDFVKIKASEYGGFLYGIESLIQLLPVEIESKKVISNIDWEIPAIEIEDQPRFQWRGLMLDLSRHFFDKEYLKQTIDGLAKHKMNILHLHLVDDQGWRIEIKKYPKLTEVGAWRVDQEDAHWNARKPTKPGEKSTYGGFLTQKDLKEIVAYAASKNVEVVPEIEMPAHVMSAIAAYPELACFDNPKPIGVPSGGVWPITDIYCAGKEHTFEFLENVLLEVMDIFPSKYIHIGGDEATKTNWKKCPYCKKRMKAEGLKNEEELQSYFVKRMEKFINKHGKKLVGWDEILEGGLAPDATVMSWRGVKGGLEAAEQGHDVVMTPGTHCYFDHYQGPQNEEPLAIGGFTPLNKVYQFDPIVDSMTPEEAKHVLGGQANLWAEYIPTTKHSEYMIYPRLAALAETVWSPKESRNWDDFSRRVQQMFKRYEFLDINYAKSTYSVTANTTVNLEDKSVILNLQNEFSNADIRYVLDDKKLDENAVKYIDSITLKKTTIVKASVFKNEKPVGRTFTDTIKFHKAVAHKINYLIPYSNKYKGAGKYTLVNTLRGTKNFHDGQWQAWLNKDMEVVINIEDVNEISEVSVGSLQNQGPGIYYPIAVEVFVSEDNKIYKKVGEVKRESAKSSKSELKDFVVKFSKIKAKYVKIKAINLKELPTGGGAWLFVDEILVE